MNPTAIYSKSGKGVQEASGKTSLLQRGDRAVLTAIDGRATLADVAQKVGKPYDAGFQKIIAQLDKDGFIRQVTAGAPGAAPAKPAAAALAPKSVPKPAARTLPETSLGDLDFSSLGAASKPASQAALEQTTVLAKAREEAEAKAAAERDKLKKEAEAKARAEMEAKVRSEAEDKLKEQAAARAKGEAEAKAKAAQEAAARQVAEAKAKVEAEARAKAEAEAKVKLEAERKAREELERKLEAERKAREEAERKARAEAERKAKEAEEKARREAEELRQRLEAERKAREEAERKAKQEAEAKAKLEAERRREEARRQEEEERRQREAEEVAQREAERAAAAAAAAMAQVEAAPGPGDGVTKKGKKKDSFADSLLADLESFTSNDDEEQKAKEEGDRQAKAEADRKRADLDRKVKDEAERRRQAEEEEQRLAEEARRAQEEERRRREAEEIRRKAEAATAAAMAKEGKKHEPKEEEDIPVTEDDLDMTEVEREEAQIAEAKAKEKEQEKEKARAAKKEKPEYVPPSRPRRPIKWGKPVTMTLALLLIIGIGAAHIVSLDTADYERAASEALGRTVKIGSANLWLFSGLPEIRFANVRVGDARITRVVASGWPGGLFGDKKEFTNVRIEGLSLPQGAIGEALFAKVRADNLSVASLTIKNLQLPGPATLPKDLFAEAAFDARGTLRSAKVEGPDGLVAKLTPKQDGSIDFEVLAGGFTLPIAPQVTLSKFAMRGVATPRGMTISEWGGALFQGGISGKATVRWAGSWNVDGVVTVRNINAAVFAPALLSSGNADGTAKFSMSAPDPAGLVAGSRLDGTFTVSQGTLGSFDLARYIQSGGRQGTGVTQFVEMNGQATYDRGTVALRNVNIGAGRLNAGASADIASSGALSGRIVADMKTEKETQRVTLLIGGTVKEPQVRN